jgi:hypothetical protein
MISHSGFCTRSESGWGSRRPSHFVSSASLISSSVRCRMKTGLPRHLMMTCPESAQTNKKTPHQPSKTYILAFGNSSEIDLDLGLGQDVGGSRHVDEELWQANSLARHMHHPLASPIHPKTSQLHSHIFPNPLPSQSHASKAPQQDSGTRTRHSLLRAHTRNSAHSTNHEVLHELRRALTLGLIPISRKVWHLSGRRAGALEGRVERGRGVDVGDGAGLHGGARGARDGQRVLRP